MNKVCSMKEAVAESVHDGDSLVIDGFTHLICFAAGHEIIRQGRRRLTAIRLTPDLVYDQLIEAGCVEKLVFSWAWQSTPERESQVTVDLKPDDDGTILTLTHEQFFNETARDDHKRGWIIALDNLERIYG